MPLTPFPVSSSNLVAVAYDKETRLLAIMFRGGALYTYDGVPPEIHNALLTANSSGSYFARQIRPKYAAVAVDPERDESLAGFVPLAEKERRKRAAGIE